MLDDQVLRQALSQWRDGNVDLGSPARDGLLERIRQVLLRFRQVGRLSAEDLVPLLRQWLLRDQRQGGAQWLKVPREAPWPSRERWLAEGFEVAEFAERIEVKANMPRIPVLGLQQDLFDDAFHLLESCRPERVPVEARIGQLLGTTWFTGHGQREAVRALICMPPDITLVANLPTGSGKSVLAQLPPLLEGRGHLTLVIVPTVALAMDQEARMVRLLEAREPGWEHRPLAFHGSLSPTKREQVFRNLRDGRQPALFTSPEAAGGSLRLALERAAAEGRLTHIVIDEAHLVASWGNGFRPAFQLLPALIRQLRALAAERAKRAIRVVLASATLTPHAVKTLQRQFGPSTRTRVISGIFLRPEPRYAVVRCSGPAEKEQRVMAALRIAPRPFILYVTRPDEADRWLERLRAAGFERVRAFTGETSGAEREHLLDDWRLDRLDGMVGTSAFGLGVDKADVRTIVHATLPESLDRFYQEVGRSGRDGRASASLLLYDSEDVGQAEGMARTRFIGNDIGFQRWLAMVDNPLPYGASGELWLDLDTLRPELNTVGKSNRLWNLRTLNLMALAGLIEVTSLSSRPPSSASEVPTGADELPESQVAYASVRILEPSHRQQLVFESHMDRARRESLEASDWALTLMKAAAAGRQPMEAILSTLYRLAQPDAWGPVATACGGCLSHWVERSSNEGRLLPFVDRLRIFGPRIDPTAALGSLPLALPNLAFVAVDDLRSTLDGPASRIGAALIGRLRPHTILLPCTAPETVHRLVQQQLQELESEAFIDTYERSRPDALAGGEGEVRLVYWLDPDIDETSISGLRAAPCAMTVVIAPRSLPDPVRPDRLLLDVVPHTDVEAAFRVLAA